MIDSEKISKISNDANPVENIEKNAQSFLGISSVQKEVFTTFPSQQFLPNISSLDVATKNSKNYRPQFTQQLKWKRIFMQDLSFVSLMTL